MSPGPRCLNTSQYAPTAVSTVVPFSVALAVAASTSAVLPIAGATPELTAI